MITPYTTLKEMHIKLRLARIEELKNQLTEELRALEKEGLEVRDFLLGKLGIWSMPILPTSDEYARTMMENVSHGSAETPISPE